MDLAFARRGGTVNGQPVVISADPVALPAALAATRERLASVDLVRGLVMVVMAIDHARDMLGGARFDPTDLSRTTAALFFTRWITHLCAPAFILLAGAGAFLSRRPRRSLSRFLFTRGLWLIVLEVTVMKVAWSFNFDPHQTAVQVIWAIGWSMIALAALVWLPLPVIGLFGAGMIATHNLFDGIAVGRLIDWTGAHPVYVGSARDWWISILHQQNFPVIYPLVPWIGVMALGYAMGPLFQLDPTRRRRALLAIGCAVSLAFLVVRALNGYGDPRPWSQQATPLFTAFSFLNITKYPPSLDYLLMTLGPVLLLLAAAERARGPVASALLVFGRVPFFFYVLHVYLIHLAAVALGVWSGFGAAPFLVGWPRFPTSYGVPLAGVYLAWILVVVALYPACRWFSQLKATRRDWWLSYL